MIKDIHALSMNFIAMCKYQHGCLLTEGAVSHFFVLSWYFENFWPAEIIVGCNWHIVTSYLPPSILPLHNLHTHLKVQICNAKYKEMTLVLVAFASWQLVKGGDKFEGTLAQVMIVCSKKDDSKLMKKKVYKNFGFTKAFLILTRNTKKH